eukprot:TRINITY_DN266_c3_g5_i8.p1 TRINITY_DN266_c3_g5~~TRINITY_DN266_c3_g5_i8.p1  ORF type:complete len:617 (+),score=254.00 TRINITY_DN266_c3_g5_i8:137-1987(+)
MAFPLILSPHPMVKRWTSEILFHGTRKLKFDRKDLVDTWVTLFQVENVTSESILMSIQVLKKLEWYLLFLPKAVQDSGIRNIFPDLGIPSFKEGAEKEMTLKSLKTWIQFYRNFVENSSKSKEVELRGDVALRAMGHLVEIFRGIPEGDRTEELLKEQNDLCEYIFRQSAARLREASLNFQVENQVENQVESARVMNSRTLHLCTAIQDLGKSQWVEKYFPDYLEIMSILIEDRLPLGQQSCLNVIADIFKLKDFNHVIFKISDALPLIPKIIRTMQENSASSVTRNNGFTVLRTIVTFPTFPMDVPTVPTEILQAITELLEAAGKNFSLAQWNETLHMLEHSMLLPSSSQKSQENFLNFFGETLTSMAPNIVRFTQLNDTFNLKKCYQHVTLLMEFSRVFADPKKVKESYYPAILKWFVFSMLSASQNDLKRQPGLVIVFLTGMVPHRRCDEGDAKVILESYIGSIINIVQDVRLYAVRISGLMTLGWMLRHKFDLLRPYVQDLKSMARKFDEISVEDSEFCEAIVWFLSNLILQLEKEEGSEFFPGIFKKFRTDFTFDVDVIKVIQDVSDRFPDESVKFKKEMEQVIEMEEPLRRYDTMMTRFNLKMSNVHASL